MEEEETTSNEQPFNLVHGWDDLHQSYSAGEVGRIKGSHDNSELELDLGPEASHKMMHDLKDKQGNVGPTVDLDDEMSEPSPMSQSMNKTMVKVETLTQLANENNFNSAVASEEKKIDTEVGKSVEDSGLANVLGKFGGNSKIKIIRLKTGDDMSDESILNSLKQIATQPGGIAVNPLLNAAGSNHSGNSLSDTIDAIGSISNGMDYESQQLARIPAENAQKFLMAMNKPKPRLPPKIENSDGIKVAGDLGGNLQIMEQNPFSNSIYGTHTLGHDLQANHGEYLSSYLIMS